MGIDRCGIDVEGSTGVQILQPIYSLTLEFVYLFRVQDGFGLGMGLDYGQGYRLMVYIPVELQTGTGLARILVLCLNSCAGVGLALPQMPVALCQLQGASCAMREALRQVQGRLPWIRQGTMRQNSIDSMAGMMRRRRGGGQHGSRPGVHPATQGARRAPEDAITQGPVAPERRAARAPP